MGSDVTDLESSIVLFEQVQLALERVDVIVFVTVALLRPLVTTAVQILSHRPDLMDLLLQTLHLVSLRVDLRTQLRS